MTTNTEIKTWQERVAPSIYADFVKRGYGMVHAAMFAEIAELRAYAAQLEQRLEAMQQQATLNLNEINKLNSFKDYQQAVKPIGQVEAIDDDMAIVALHHSFPSLGTLLYAHPHIAMQPDVERDAALSMVLSDGYEGGTMTDDDLAGVITLHYVSPACAENAFTAISNTIAAQQAKKAGKS